MVSDRFTKMDVTPNIVFLHVAAWKFSHNVLSHHGARASHEATRLLHVCLVASGHASATVLDYAWDAWLLASMTMHVDEVSSQCLGDEPSFLAVYSKCR